MTDRYAIRTELHGEHRNIAIGLFAVANGLFAIADSIKTLRPVETTVNDWVQEARNQSKDLR